MPRKSSDVDNASDELDFVAPEKGSVPLEVEILTKDHEIKGIVYVSRDVKEKRRLTDLLNDPKKRFIAVTDAFLINRNGSSSPRRYSFLQVHMDNIIMLHPSTESTAKSVNYSEKQTKSFNQIRNKLT